MSKNITIIYPSLFGELSSPWLEEYAIAKEQGFSVATFEEDTFKIKKNLSNEAVLYRGWMLSPDDYAKLTDSVQKKKGAMIVPKVQFGKANSFSSWYQVLNRYTMKSHFIKDFSKLDELFKDGESYFIKDNLKSLGSEKSIANSKKEAIEIYEEIQKNRDFEIQDNVICLREIVPIENEERFFVINGKIIGTHTDQARIDFVQQVADTILKRIGLVFVSIDVATSNIRNILVEVGGLQVSDMSKDGEKKEVEACYEGLKKELDNII